MWYYLILGFVAGLLAVPCLQLSLALWRQRGELRLRIETRERRQMMIRGDYD